MDLFELSAKIELDTGEYEKSVEDAAEKAEDLEESLKSAGKGADKAEDKIDGLGKTSKKTSKETDGLGDSVNKSKDSFFGSMVKADLFVGALEKVGEVATEVAQYIWGLDEATKDYRVSQGKLNTSFKIAGFGANTAKEAFRGLYLAAGDIDRATEASQLLAQLSLDTQDVTDWVTIATGVVGTFGDSLPIESLIESANETARVGKVTGTLADALNWAGSVGEDEFNAMLASCETQEERVNLITETLMGTYKEAADTFEESSAQIRKARDAYLIIQDAASGAGAAVENAKASMLNASQFAQIGFYDGIESAANALTKFSDSSSYATNRAREWIDSLNTRISTGSIEEVKDAMQEMQRYYDYINEHPFDSMFQLGGIFTAAGVMAEVGNAQELLKQRLEGTAEAADGAANSESNLAGETEGLSETVLPTIEAIDGLTYAIENTTLTSEEAAAQYKTYADAATEMFSRISTESELSYEDVVANLEHNWQATNDFANNMNSLAGVLPESLRQTFAAGGPSMYAGVVAMLAEANRGSDEGLTELNKQYKLGGDAAMKAFLASLGAVPETTQDPAKIVAAQMEEDTSMEQAGVTVVTQTASAMSDAVSSSGFDSSGALAMMKFISGMEAQRGAIMSKARDLAQAAKREIDQVLDGIGKGGKGGGRAGGLDYVPINGYPAVLHKGEAVLTAREAKEWRSGESGTPSGRSVVINQYINAVPQTPAQFAAATQAYFQEAVWAL